MKIVFLNDLHPLTAPGAASVAYSLALEASRDHQVEFWCSEISGVPIPIDSQINVKIRQISEVRTQKMNGNVLNRLYFEILGLRELVWVIRQVKTTKPTHIWIHQIGNRFPKLLIPICTLFGISTLTTLHDFGVILGRKLYPSDFGWSPEHTDTHIAQIDRIPPSIKNSQGSREILIKARRILVRYWLNKSSATVCISELQQEILGSCGFKISRVVPNGVDECSCVSKLSTGTNELNVLFAGRPNAKGLELLLQAFSEYPNSHLHLAGPYRLVEIADNYLGPEKYTYHGILNSDEVYELIHKVDVVSVLSQCFDVYPTITLEALAHSTPAITTLLTGNALLVHSLSHELVVPFDQVPDLKRIAEFLRVQKLVFPKVPNVQEVWKQYEEILIQIS